MNTTAKNLATFLVAQAMRAEYLLVQVATQDENVRELYERRLAPVIAGIRSGNIVAPSSALSDYWYYYSPEGPWNVWSNFPELVSLPSTLINLLGLGGDSEFTNIVAGTAQSIPEGRTRAQTCTAGSCIPMRSRRFATRPTEMWL